MPVTGLLELLKRYGVATEPAACRIGSFELFGDFVEPGLDARLVDTRRAGHADPGNNLVAEFDRQPTGNGDDVIDCSARGDIVLDGFLGRGTTVIAAERTGRRR